MKMVTSSPCSPPPQIFCNSLAGAEAHRAYTRATSTILLHGSALLTISAATATPWSAPDGAFTTTPSPRISLLATSRSIHSIPDPLITALEPRPLALLEALLPPSPPAFQSLLALRPPQTHGPSILRSARLMFRITT